MAGYDFQKAKSEMDFMFKGLKQEIEGNKIYGVKVPLKYSLLITRGKNSLVFRLPESGLVGKSSFYDTITKEKDSNHKGYFMLTGYASGLMSCGLEMTIESLKDMGFGERIDLFLPEMHEYDCKINMWHPKRVHYTLMSDLREKGKYQLQDAEDFNFDSHHSGKNLRELYDKICEEILQACKSGSYELTCAGHGSEEDPDPAIRQMFLVQFNDNQGMLVLADLNHLVIKKK
ncbi:hypothetical protein J4214_02740 [Candidatus Woesearchaeota archaeon]|nr:hypothetical protein [Candidatus Woesearchaeota archaeon]